MAIELTYVRVIRIVPVVTDSSLKTKVRTALAKRNRTQRWLADELGISESLLARILVYERSASEEVRNGIHALIGVRIPRVA